MTSPLAPGLMPWCTPGSQVNVWHGQSCIGSPNGACHGWVQEGGHICGKGYQEAHVRTHLSLLGSWRGSLLGARSMCGIDGAASGVPTEPAMEGGRKEGTYLPMAAGGFLAPSDAAHHAVAGSGMQHAKAAQVSCDILMLPLQSLMHTGLQVHAHG